MGKTGHVEVTGPHRCVVNQPFGSVGLLELVFGISKLESFDHFCLRPRGPKCSVFFFLVCEVCNWILSSHLAPQHTQQSKGLWPTRSFAYIYTSGAQVQNNRITPRNPTKSHKTNTCASVMLFLLTNCRLDVRSLKLTVRTVKNWSGPKGNCN